MPVPSRTPTSLLSPAVALACDTMLSRETKKKSEGKKKPCWPTSVAAIMLQRAVRSIRLHFEDPIINGLDGFPCSVVLRTCCCAISSRLQHQNAPTSPLLGADRHSQG
ncbi:hypothetical protein BDV11DRAFT_199951 [Aspergillus similis]